MDTDDEAREFLDLLDTLRKGDIAPKIVGAGIIVFAVGVILSVVFVVGSTTRPALSPWQGIALAGVASAGVTLAMTLGALAGLTWREHVRSITQEYTRAGIAAINALAVTATVERARIYRESVSAERMPGRIVLPEDRQRTVYYILDHGCNQVKIGHSVDPITRMKQLEGETKSKLVLLYAEPGGIDSERFLHATFARLRQRGEWFAYEDELKRHVESLIAAQRATTMPERGG